MTSVTYNSCASSDANEEETAKKYCVGGGESTSDVVTEQIQTKDSHKMEEPSCIYNDQRQYQKITEKL